MSADPELRERTLPELLRELGDETATLIRQEMALARVELVEKGKSASATVPLFGATAIFGLGAFGAVTTFLIAVLALAMPVWLAALIVTVIYGGIALVAAQTGKKKLQHVGSLVPEQTAETVKEDIEWAKTRAKSGAK